MPTDPRYDEALRSLDHTIEKLRRCSDDEKEQLKQQLRDLRSMTEKLTRGRVEIVVFGEISTGKSALINALIGDQVAAVDVQGGWTREVWHVAWEGCGYRVPGLEQSEVVLVDTPGLNEVGGADRGVMAREAAERADLILFVTDSDLNETEYSALVELAAVHKPILVVLNKIDLYTPEQLDRLIEVIRGERLADLIPAESVVLAAANPREIEVVIESADGTTRSEQRRPEPKIADLKVRILEVLENDGLALLALNAAMFAADRSDQVSSVRIRLRNHRAQQTIASYATIKSLAVAMNPLPLVDVLGGTAVDATMVATLAKIYGLEMSWMHARKLVKSIVKAAGWVIAGELLTHAASSLFKAATVGYGTVLTAVPQGAAAGYGSYIVGQAARYYFEHGASWGGQSAKVVVRRILDDTDKESVIESLRDEIKNKLARNPYAE